MHREEREVARIRAALVLSSIVATLAVASLSHADGTAKATTHVVEIGSARAEVVNASASSDKAGDAKDAYIQKPAAGKRDEISLRGGSALARDLAPLLGEGLTKECARKVDASLAFVGADGNELARMSFAWAVVTEVALPALDVSAGAAAEVSVKLEPQFPKRIFQKGAVAKPPPGPEWKRSGFKLSIDGVDAALKSTKQVGELKIVQAPAAGTPVTCAVPVVSDLTFAVPDGDAAALAGWTGAKNGTLDYLSADGASVLKVKLTGLRKKSASADKGVTRVTASVESVTLARK